MTAKGSELVFISRIKRDGSGVVAIEDQEEVRHFMDAIFELNCLSITQGTYIACAFNSYVVKLKNKQAS